MAESLQSQWAQHINNWKKSDVSQKQFCESKGLSIHQFGYWRRKLSSPQELDIFLPIKTKSSFSIILNDTKLVFEDEPNPVWMASFVKSFQEVHAQS